MKTLYAANAGKPTCFEVAVAEFEAKMQRKKISPKGDKAALSPIRDTRPHHAECEVVGYGVCTCDEYYARDEARKNESK